MLPNDFWGRKWNPCIADKQQSGTLALTSCSNFSIEALTLTRLSLTSLVIIYTLNFPILSGSKKVSVRVPQDQPNVLVCLPGPGQLLSGASPHIPHTLHAGIRGYWLSQGTSKETGMSQKQFRTQNLALCFKFPPHNITFFLPQCGAWQSGS